MDRNNRTEDLNTRDEIDLIELAGVLWRKILVLLLCLIIGASAAGVVTHFFITPQYQATSMIYIYSKTTSVTSLADLQIGSQLTVDFEVIATTREVVENAISDLGLDLTYEEARAKITTSNPSNSRILSISVTDPDPELARDLSNTLADELRERIADVMNTDEPSMVERAVAPTKPASPSLKRNMAIGGAVMFIIAAAVIIVRYMMDDTIKTEDDVEKYLGQTVLAVIPIDRTQKKTGRTRSDHGSGDSGNTGVFGKRRRSAS